VTTFTILVTIGKTTHHNSDDEIKLLGRIKTRDINALEELYDLYKRLLFGISHIYCKETKKSRKSASENFCEYLE
jgi:hypothetical protein